MANRNYQDILAGLALVLIGGFAAGQAFIALPLGRISSMGPGMFPAALGVILISIGIMLLLPALRQAGEAMERPDIRSFTAIMVSIFAFGILLIPFGLIPSVVAQTLISSRADSKLSLLQALLLAAALSAGAYLTFRIGLGLPVQAITWPGA